MTEFTNNQILISALPNWQDVQFEKISSKYKTVVLIQYVFIILIFLIILFGVFWLNDDPWNITYQIILLVGLGFLSFLLILSLFSIRFWGYALREQDVLYRSGIFSKSVKIIPFKQIQHVDIKEGAVSRLFNLSSIELHTAGAGEGLNIPGIAVDKIASMQEYISQKISHKTLN
ncbi:MAG: PH domain-containing protein [Sphingobacterium composti]|uniref:PH domain-containing protein n=1 Tax=Sphingobacterium composti TaxID=363260 RepID=UPI00135AD89E|nr:PH domain-containing protein [Sphingobacterium composti Ten et al. 2007 non Yoo et al. 2007]